MIDTIEVLLWAEDTAIAQAVGHHTPRGGDVYAYYSNISCVRLYLHIENYEEKQQPPLWYGPSKVDREIT